MRPIDRPSEESLLRLLQAVPHPYLVLRPDPPRFTVVAASDAFLRATTTRREEIVGRGLFDVFPESPAADEVSDLRASLDRVLATRAPDRMPVRRHDAWRPEAEGGGLEERHREPRNLPVLGPDGGIEFVIHQLEDVTGLVGLRARAGRADAEAARARATLAAVEAALREGEDHLRHTVELSPQMSWTGDALGRVTGISRRWRTATGLASQEAMGEGWRRALHADDLPGAAAAWERSVTTGAPLDAEARLRMADGSYRWWRTRAYPRRDADGRVVRWYGTTEDIHDRRTVEEALRAERERLRLILESATEYAIFATDLDRRIVSWNEGARRLLGWAEEEILGRHSDAIFTPEDRDAGVPEREAATALSEGRAENERWHLRSDGSRFWASGLAMPLRDPEGGPGAPPLGILAIMRDQTERRRAEERRSVLVNELNHRVKNTLAVVQSLALQTTRDAPGLTAFAASFQRRILALARAHDLLTREDWTGAPLGGVVRAGLAPLAVDGARVDLAVCDGPDVVLPPGAALTLAMAVHELAANALRHGALSVPGGRVRVVCLAAGDGRGGAPWPALEWLERGGPPVAGPPARRGFGLRLLERGLAAQAGMGADIRFEPDGVRCTLRLPPAPPPRVGLPAARG